MSAEDITVCSTCHVTFSSHEEHTCIELKEDEIEVKERIFDKENESDNIPKIKKNKNEIVKKREINQKIENIGTPEKTSTSVTLEIFTNESITKSEVAKDEIAKGEVAKSEVAKSEVANNEVAKREVAKSKIQSNQLKREKVPCGHCGKEISKNNIAGHIKNIHSGKVKKKRGRPKNLEPWAKIRESKRSGENSDIFTLTCT